jgi:hypothetical protein
MPVGKTIYVYATDWYLQGKNRPGRDITQNPLLSRELIGFITPWGGNPPFLANLGAAGGAMGVTVLPVALKSPGELDSVFSALVVEWQERPGPELDLPDRGRTELRRSASNIRGLKVLVRVKPNQRPPLTVVLFSEFGCCRMLYHPVITRSGG